MPGHRAYPHSQMCAKELPRMQGPSEMFALFCLSNHYVFVCEWECIYVNLSGPYIPKYIFLNNSIAFWVSDSFIIWNLKILTFHILLKVVLMSYSHGPQWCIYLYQHIAPIKSLFDFYILYLLWRSIPCLTTSPPKFVWLLWSLHDPAWWALGLGTIHFNAQYSSGVTAKRIKLNVSCVNKNVCLQQLLQKVLVIVPHKSTFFNTKCCIMLM